MASKTPPSAETISPTNAKLRTYQNQDSDSISCKTPSVAVESVYLRVNQQSHSKTHLPRPNPRKILIAEVLHAILLLRITAAKFLVAFSQGCGSFDPSLSTHDRTEQKVEDGSILGKSR